MIFIKNIEVESSESNDIHVQVVVSSSSSDINIQIIKSS